MVIIINNIFDTHAHYTEYAFDSDRSELLESLPEKGVRFIMLASSSVETSVQNNDISHKYNYIYASAGVHPESAGDTPDGYIDALEQIIRSNPKMKAVGEIGLDYHYDGYDRNRQLELFRRQLELAKKLDLPAIIHSRDAAEDMMSVLREYRPKGVMHCFSGSAETAREVIGLGLYVGFTGVLTFKNAKKSIGVIKTLPSDRILLETDCPYMAPVPFRGKRCDSSMIVYTAQAAAEALGGTVQEILDLTCENGRKLFGI